MTLLYRNSVWDPWQQMFQEMNRVFVTDFLSTGKAAMEKAAFSPKVDLAENDQEIKVLAELPGLTEKDVEVSLDNGMINIKGEKQQEKTEEKQQHYHYVERKYGSFCRSIPIPVEVDSSKVAATFKNGVLEISLPKKTPTSQAKRVEIQSS